MLKLKENLPDWFLYGNISWYENLYYLVSKDVKEYSNASFLDNHVMEIFNLFIKKHLQANNLNPSDFLKDTVIVLAHWKSDKNSYLVYSDEFKSYDVEDFLDYFPKDKKILFYVCNRWNYQLNRNDLKIIYPASNTGVKNLQFNISQALLDELNQK